MWFSPATQSLIAYIKETQKVVNGTAKSNCIREALRSWLVNHQILFTMKIWRRIPVQIPLTKMQLLALLSCGDFQPRFILRFKKRQIGLLDREVDVIWLRIQKLWGGRFEGTVEDWVERFGAVYL